MLPAMEQTKPLESNVNIIFRQLFAIDLFHRFLGELFNAILHEQLHWLTLDLNLLLWVNPFTKLFLENEKPISQLHSRLEPVGFYGRRSGLSGDDEGSSGFGREESVWRRAETKREGSRRSHGGGGMRWWEKVGYVWPFLYKERWALELAKGSSFFSSSVVSRKQTLPRFFVFKYKWNWNQFLDSNLMKLFIFYNFLIEAALTSNQI